VRSKSQFGFRKEVGTISALFTLKHAIHATCSPLNQGGKGGALAACFVDFSKAFDSVNRDLLWKRLADLGIRGTFLCALKDLYSQCRLHVKVNGKLSTDAFFTLSGVKQGCPLSPTLFGLFIEQLDEFLRLRLPHIGFSIQGQKHGDLMYADDVTLLAESVADLQSLLNCFEELCEHYGMSVNIPKTEIVIFCPEHGPHRKKVDPFVSYKGCPLKVSQSFPYLGMLISKNRWFAHSAEKLALSANRALLAMLSSCQASHAVSIPIKLRLFDILVRTVGSYACQVWGVDYLKLDDAKKILNNPLQKIQLMFLRSIGGIRSTTCSWAVLQEFGQLPVQVNWICLCARYWNKTAISNHLNGDAIRADVALFSKGNTSCWSYKFLKCMTDLDLCDGLSIYGLQHQSHETTLGLRFSELEVRNACIEKYNKVWGVHALNICPREVPSSGAMRHKYMAWFHDETAPCQKHLADFHSKGPHQLLIRFCLHSWNLECNSDHSVPRHRRVCKLCNKQQIEDEKHVIFECSHYEGIREEYKHLFEGYQNNMKKFMNQKNQSDIMRFLRKVHWARFHR
jgi:hypothetical protein